MTEAHSAPTRPTGTGPPDAVSGPVVRDHTVTGRDDAVLRFRGRLVGFTTSQADEHSHPTGTPLRRAVWAARGDRCSACRWFEVRIFVVEHEYVGSCTCGAPVHEPGVPHEPSCGVEPPRGRYLVLTEGHSRVPGETVRRREGWTDSGFVVVELLTQRAADGPFIPITSARALAEAAAHDEGLRDAYVNRAVV